MSKPLELSAEGLSEKVADDQKLTLVDMGDNGECFALTFEDEQGQRFDVPVFELYDLALVNGR